MNDAEEFNEVQQELLKEARAANKVDRDRAELFAALILTPGWKAYEELLRARIEQQGELLLQPAGSVDGAIVAEYEKGTMRGLLIARDLPHHTIGAAKQLSDPDTEN